MEYKIYKLEFSTGVHFGSKKLEDAGYILRADTLFSAICNVCAEHGADRLDKLVAAVNDNRIRISDALPYIGETLYIPKPMYRVDSGDNKGDSEIKKAYKKLSYVPVDKLEKYLAGNLDVKAENRRFSDGIGQQDVKVCASILGQEETKPFRVGVYYFKEKSGLYVIAGFEDDEARELLEESMDELSYTGIGGERSSGLGRFTCHVSKIPEVLQKRLTSDADVYMSLSVCLPTNEELEKVLEDANYMLIKRSGFAATFDTDSGQALKKNDLYVMQAGSCFAKSFEGGLYDVNGGGINHPVYRYAKPLLMEVK